MDKDKKRRIMDYLEGKLSTSKLILFTGSGFSKGAQDKQRKYLPDSEELAKEIWDMIYDNNFDNSSLKDIFSVAVGRIQNQLCRYLKKRLTVDPSSLGDEYKVLIEQPWHQIYTLNIDDLFKAAQAQFGF